MIDEQVLNILVGNAPATAAFLAQAGDYGFWGPIIATLRGVGLAAAGVGLVVSILIKGAAATNGDRHAFAARVAEGIFAGLFLIMLGWFIYDRIVEWTPL
jgi:hypothetical protein